MKTDNHWTSAFRPLQAGEIHLWRCPLDTPNPAAFQPLLVEEEIHRMERFCRPDLRRRFAIARGSLRVLAGRYLGEDPADLRFAYTEHGKPVVEGAPLHFNISHSGDLMVAAFGLDGPLGVDVETVSPRLHARDIARRYFSEAERAEMETPDEAEFLRNFFRLWTAKEAVMKATALGFALELSKIEIGLHPRRVRFLDWDGPGAWQLREFSPAEGFLGTLASLAGTRTENFALV